MRWHTVGDGDGCTKLETDFALTQAQLFALNPNLAPSTPLTFIHGFI
jgi:hypothetical protein